MSVDEQKTTTPRAGNFSQNRNAVSLGFVMELTQQLAAPVEFLEASLETTLGYQVFHALH